MTHHLVIQVLSVLTLMENSLVSACLAIQGMDLLVKVTHNVLQC